MNELVSVPISPWYTIPAAVGLLAVTFVFAPGALLYLGVLIYPKGHDRRQEFTAELNAVPYIKRPFWVTGVLVRCLFEGLPARVKSIRVRRSTHKPYVVVRELRYDEAFEVIARRKYVPRWHRLLPRRTEWPFGMWRVRPKRGRRREDPPA